MLHPIWLFYSLRKYLKNRHKLWPYIPCFEVKAKMQEIQNIIIITLGENIMPVSPCE